MGATLPKSQKFTRSALTSDGIGNGSSGEEVQGESEGYSLERRAKISRRVKRDRFAARGGETIRLLSRGTVQKAGSHGVSIENRASK